MSRRISQLMTAIVWGKKIADSGWIDPMFKNMSEEAQRKSVSEGYGRVFEREMDKLRSELNKKRHD